MSKIKQNYMKVIELFFKISYLFLVLGTFNSYIYSSPMQSGLVKLALLTGGILILCRMIQFKRYKKIPCIILMLLFCGSMLFSAIMNRKYGIMGDLKWIIWTGLQFFGLYLCDIERDHSQYKKEFAIIANIMIVYACICSVVSLGMLITKSTIIWDTKEGERMISGFVWGRLWGVYTDPNYAAVFTVVVLLLSILFLVRAKHVLMKIVYILCAGVNFLFLVFTDSRTGEIALLCSGGFCIFMICVRKGFSKRKTVRAGVSAIACLVLGIALAGSIYVVKTQYNQKLSPIFAEIIPKEKEDIKTKSPEKQNKAEQDTGKNVKKQNKEKSVKTQSAEKSVRQQSIEKDVSSGRFAIWESGLEVWKTAPVYGTGYTTFIPYTKETLPDTYVVNNPQGDYVSLHNAFLNTLVYQGIIGFVILIMIGLRIIKYIWRPILQAETPEYCDMIFILACIGAVVVSMFFLLEGTYTNSPGSFVLWTFSGYLMHYAYRTRKEN